MSTRQRTTFHSINEDSRSYKSLLSSIYESSTDQETTTNLPVGIINNNNSTSIPVWSTFNFTTSLIQGKEIEDNTHQYVLYVGSGISMFSIMIALVTYTTSRKFRVKRPHMITINLCTSLLIFYIGILLTVSYNTNHKSPGEVSVANETSAGCSTGAFFFELGMLFTWTWITVHWVYLTYTVNNVAAPHISHFFIKVTLPAYSFPTLLVCCVVVAGHIFENDYIHSETCSFDMGNKLVLSINFGYFAICLSLITACVTYCVMRLTCRRHRNQVPSTYMRIKMSVTRLATITAGVVITTVFELVRWVLGSNVRHGFEIFNGVVLGTVGIVIVIGLIFRSKEFRMYWMHVFRGDEEQISIIRRALTVVRRRSKKLKSDGKTGGYYDGSRNLSPGASSIGTCSDILSPPVKMVPRDSPVNTESGADVFRFPSVRKNSEADIKSDENANTDRATPEGLAKVERKESTVSRKSTKRRARKPAVTSNTVSRMTSIRQKVLRKSIHRASSKHETNSPPVSPLPTLRKVSQNSIGPSNTETVERVSLASSSLDIYRKTSF